MTDNTIHENAGVEDQKQRITQISKAIRYKARKEGGNLFKAFNDYMGSASGVSATERQAVKQKLGLTEVYSSWRDDLREVADIPSSEPKKDNEMKQAIKEKKVSNKVVINPPMKEAIESLGGVIVEATEFIDIEEEMTPEEKKAVKNKEMMMKKQHMLDKQRMQMQKQGRLATSSQMEETEDSLRDKRMERGGVGGNIRYDIPPKASTNTFGKKKPSGKSALDMVKSDIRAKYGKGAIIDTKKK